MFKETINSSEQNIVISIPKSYLNRELVISIIPKGKKKRSFEKYFGIMKTENIDIDIKDLRNQWDRI